MQERKIDHHHLIFCEAQKASLQNSELLAIDALEISKASFVGDKNEVCHLQLLTVEINLSSASVAK